MAESLSDASEVERVSYLKQTVFDDVIGAEVRVATESEWGEYVLVVDEDVRWVGESESSLEAWAKSALSEEDEFFFEKVMYKHPSWPEDTVCMSFTSLEDNVFR